MTKKLISLRISKATEAKLGQLAKYHGTQTEAIATAIDRLYTSTQKERMMDGSELYTLFANDTEMADVAKLTLNDITNQIGEFRSDECDIDMTDREIAEAIREFAREHVAEFGK